MALFKNYIKKKVLKRIAPILFPAYKSSDLYVGQIAVVSKTGKIVKVLGDDASTQSFIVLEDGINKFYGLHDGSLSRLEIATFRKGDQEVLPKYLSYLGDFFLHDLQVFAEPEEDNSVLYALDDTRFLKLGTHADSILYLSEEGQNAIVDRNGYPLNSTSPTLYRKLNLSF